MRRRLRVVLIALGLAALATGCAQATPVRPSPVVLPASPTQPPPPPLSSVPTLTPVATKTAAAAAPTAAVTPAAPVAKPGAAPLTLKVTSPLDESVVNASVITVTGQTTPGAVVSIDGDLVDVEASGKFQAQVTLEEGPNVLEITASDDKGSELNSVVRLIYEP
ncbi:MAG: hypothetical protein ACM3S0_16880 [Acidobacteriota bacterium]